MDVHGHRWVEHELELSLDDLAAMVRHTLRVTMECAGNGRAGVDPRPSVSPGSRARSGRTNGPAYAWGMCSTAMNGLPLLPQHGFPVRLVVPGWYGMASVKWLREIRLLDHEFDGYQHHAYRLGNTGTASAPR